MNIKEAIEIARRADEWGNPAGWGQEDYQHWVREFPPQDVLPLLEFVAAFDAWMPLDGSETPGIGLAECHAMLAARRKIDD